MLTDHADQLDALIPIKERFGRGSLIVVTTWECEVITTWGISSIYKIKALDPCNVLACFDLRCLLKGS